MAGSHWKSAVDPRTDRTYYYHEITRETQWRKPMELASNEERQAMEDKERKQKDFFATMEANILNSLSQGQVPGSPKKELSRRKSSNRPAERPELVRTISTMNDIVLKNLIQRQPSFRNVKKTGSIHKTASLNPGEFENTKRGSAISDNEFESFVSLMSSEKERLDPLHESNDDSMPELFSYLPDESEYSLEGSGAFGDDSTIRSDGGALNESSIAGFGLTWEETQALKKLASITKEMIHAETEEEDTIKGSSHRIAPATTPSWKGRDSKGQRDLPREIEIDDDEESDIVSQVPSKSTGPSAFQKAKDIGGRELDFDSSDESEEDEDEDPAPLKSEPKSNGKGEELMTRPPVKRRNTCGTLYVGTTMSAPDKDATIKVRTDESATTEVYLN